MESFEQEFYRTDKSAIPAILSLVIISSLLNQLGRKLTVSSINFWKINPIRRRTVPLQSQPKQQLEKMAKPYVSLMKMVKDWENDLKEEQDFFHFKKTLGFCFLYHKHPKNFSFQISNCKIVLIFCV